MFLLMIVTPSARADDVADVKATAAQYADAVAARDVAKMKASSTAGSARFVERFVAMIQSFQKLNDAGMSRFKRRITENDFAPRTHAEIDAADVNVTGDTATLTFKSDPARPPERPTVLKREGDAWRVDFVAGMRSDPEKLLAFLDASAKAANEIADELKSGKYASVEETQAAMRQKVSDTLRNAATNGKNDH
jgi:hypothetical protein